MHTEVAASTTVYEMLKKFQRENQSPVAPNNQRIPKPNTLYMAVSSITSITI